MSIRTRLTLWYSALLATVILVFGVALFAMLNWAWRSQLQENMRLLTEQMVDTIGLAFNGDTGEIAPGPVQRRVTQMLSTAAGMYVQLWDVHGGLIAQTPNVGFNEPFYADGLLQPVPVVIDVNLQNDIHALVSSVPILSPDTIRLGTIQIMTPLTMLEAATDRLLRVMLAIGGLALVLAFLVGSFFSGQILQPIETISQIARQITAADDLSKRIPYEGPMDELGHLTQTFNTTLSRLERLFKTQRRFIADISHELRTPLTAIQGNVDLIKRFYPQLKDTLEIEAIAGESRRMTRLVEDLLLLAQADSGRMSLHMEPIELASLTLDVYRSAHILAGEKITLKLGTLDAVYIHGDTDRLKQLMLNLITNAIKYTPEGGTVGIQITHENGFALLAVSDTGIGIPAEDLPHVFERFYRVDKARAREMGGSGLGLSIASWIVEAHHGKIWAESTLGKGSTFYVRIPSIESNTVPDSVRDTRQRIPILRRTLNSHTPSAEPDRSSPRR